jgi:2-polyprenyl-6-methoxyphenol hydroxylase-like FAD-dependent oxidoreductase
MLHHSRPRALTHLATQTNSVFRVSGGYPATILDRPAFYDCLLKNLPKEKIHYGKKVIAIEQDQHSATVRCADGRYATNLF